MNFPLFITIINCLLALLVLGAAMFRCMRSTSHGTDLQARFSWNMWILAHVLMGSGCFGYICAKISGIEPQVSLSLLLAGLSILLLFPWHRRKGE